MEMFGCPRGSSVPYQDCPPFKIKGCGECVETCDPYTKYKRPVDQALFNQSTAFSADNMLYRYIPNGIPSLPNPPYLPQTGDPVYPWRYNVLPSEELTSIPDAPTPPYPPATPAVPNLDGYDKYKSIGPNFYYFLGYDFFSIQPEESSMSLFLTNLKARGPDNYQKKQYMYAFKSDFLHFYEEKIDAFLNEVFVEITGKKKPVLSTFNESLIKFVLDIHLGYAVHPEFAYEYLRQLLLMIGKFIQHADNPEGAAVLNYGWQYTDPFKKYIQDRIEVIMQNEDKTTFTYWWVVAGMNSELVQTEIIHNLVTIIQYSKINYLLALDQVDGTHFPPYQYYDENTDTLLPAPNVVIKYNFLEIFKLSPDDTARINCIRETMRLTAPNEFSVSHVIGEDHTPNWLVSFHLHQSLMIPAYEAHFGPNSYFAYNTAKYADFNTDFEGSCPVIHGGLGKVNDIAQYFEKSPVDNETVLDRCNPKIAPVYSTLLYTPFGLGYRRCAGEAFNMVFLSKMMDRFKDLQYEFRAPQANYKPLVTLGTFLMVPDNLFVVS